MRKYCKDLTGQKFGKLTIIKRVENNNVGSAIWLCKCDCGKETSVVSRSLVQGTTKSCGCLRKSLILPYGESAFRRYYYHIITDAKKRNIKFNLEKKYVKNLIRHRCFYCGIEPKQEFKIVRGNGNLIYNGIDRLDSLKGYEIGNVVPCCGRCNEAKNDLHFKDYIEWINRTYYFLFDKKKYIEVFESNEKSCANGICGS